MHGTFNDWAEPGLAPGSRPRSGRRLAGTWSVDRARGGSSARSTATGSQTPAGVLSRIDPYARQVTSSIGNAVVYDPAAFDWGEHGLRDAGLERGRDLRDAHRHVRRRRATRPGTFDRAIRRMAYLQELGIGAIQVMPPFEYAGDVSWGYNPAHIFAIESTYGGPDAFKRFVRAAHEHGIAVIVDVVYNHLGPGRPRPVALRRLGREGRRLWCEFHIVRTTRNSALPLSIRA